MDGNNSMVIDVWKGDWGLPSIDLECLKVLAAVKFSGLAYEVKKTNNPFWSPSGTLPVVHQGKHTYTSYDEVLSYLIRKNVNPDHGLSTFQESESVAYVNMLQEKLYPALQYIWLVYENFPIYEALKLCLQEKWVDEQNFTKLTRPWYAKAMPFPFNFYYVPKYLKQAQQMVEAIHGSELSQSEIENKIYSEAEKCLTALSVRLGDTSDYMFGSHPTTLDAIMFAYLAPLLKAPFKNPVLQNHLKACSNLYKYVLRINMRYFSKDYKEYENKLKEEAMSSKPIDREKDYPSSIAAAIIALAAMVGYAFSIGIVQTPSVEEKFEEDEGYYPGENYEEER